MTTSGNVAARYRRRLRANWPALLLPLIATGALLAAHGLTWSDPGGVIAVLPPLVIVAVGALALGAPEAGAKAAPRLFIAEKSVAEHAAGIFARPGLAPSDDDNRRVLAVLAYLNG